MPNPRRFAFAACVLALATPACKSKKVEEIVKKDVPVKKAITEVPLPEGAVGEIVIKDPELFVKKLADGAGFGPMVGPSPYQKLIDSISDENAKKAIKAIDPHGTMAALGLAKIAHGEKPHGAVAARLKDPDIAAAALGAAAKSGGNVKTWESKVLETTVFEPGTEGEIAIYGDVVIVADSREALDAAGKYVAWRATSSKVDHELVARIATDKMGPQLAKMGNEEWAKLKPGDIPPKIKAEIDPMIGPVLTGISDMGELLLNVDINGDQLVFDEKLGAKGSFATWLGKYPTGDATALLSMPKGESVALYRYPDGLGPVIYSLVDYGLESTKLTPAERADTSKHARVFGAALGHQVAYVSTAGGGAGVNTEYLIRFDLDDAPNAKKAIPELRKLIEKAVGSATKPKITAYKKFGSEGESFATPAMLPSMVPGASGAPTDDTWTYATKGSQLFLDVCLGCVPKLLEPALDPAAKGATLDSDPAAKAKIAEFPGKGLASASWSTTLSLPGMGGGMGMLMGAGAPPPKKPGGPAAWGWAQTASEGVVAKGQMPLPLIGELLKSYLAMSAMGGMGMGGAPPPY